MNLLLTSIHIEESPRAVPLGPAMLASVLKKEFPNKLKIDIQNLFLTQSLPECAEIILEHDPHCIGFSMYIWNRNLTMEIAGILKQRKPDIIIFAGGPEVSADPGNILKNNSIDFVLAGEGEEIIIQAMDYLLKGGNPSEISGIVSPSPVKNLSALPSPFLDQTLNPANYSGILWELSRGCPFNCDFCYESRGTTGIRRFPIDRILAELRLFEESKVDQVFVLDPTFNYNKETAKEILQLIIEEAPEICFFFEVRSEFIDAEMADLFASINCSLQIGIQSASNEVLKNINRKIDTDDFTSKMLLLHEAGISYGLDLIYGLPGDTLEGFCASIDFAIGFVPNHIDIFPLTVLPGTRLHETAPSFGLEYQADNPYKVMSSPEFSGNDMKSAEELAHAFDLFYNKGKAVPWFNIVINTLELTPSAFFREFAEWLKTKPEEDVISLQKNFIAWAFEKNEKSALTSIASDIITYFGYSEYPAEDDILASFNYNPTELIEQLDAGITDLEELSILLRAAK
ncbi:MAG: B12-binding domain-containing radical SAM protein [Kiritimatiellae bacterium]|nr:B12-binding domain-containing radical SAM protein [Kiritimatiellia bacterium]